MTARTHLDSLIAAVDALGVRSVEVRQVDMVDRIDHIVVISVHTTAEVDALAAQLDLLDPIDRSDFDFRWREARNYQTRGVSIIVQGAHHFSRGHAA